MLLRLFRLLAAVSVVLAGVSAPLPAMAQTDKALTILRITPSGEGVTGTRQIVIQFNRPVVAVGDVKREADQTGVTITPYVKCEWRWLNRSVLSCNLGQNDALAMATAYQVTVEPKIEAEDGTMVAEAFKHSFTTMTATVDQTYVRTWISPVLPVFYVGFNQAVTKDSIEQHLYFEDEKTGARIAAIAEKREDDDSEPQKKGELEARNNWLVKPAAPLPENSGILIKEEPGLISVAGDAIGTITRDLRKFYTYPALALRGIYCRDKTNAEIFIAPAAPQTDAQLCNPLASISLSFTAPVMRSQLKDHLLFTPDITGGNKAVNPWGDGGDWSRLADERADQAADYRITLPYGLKAAQEYNISVPQKKLNVWERIKALFTGEQPQAVTKLTDEFGRSIAPFSIAFATGHRNPNFELPYNDAVLEKNTDSDVPLYVNNLNSYEFSYQKMDTADYGEGTTGAMPVAKAQDVQFGVPAGVRKMLDGKSGALFGWLTTDPVVTGKWERAGRLFAQVTPYQVYTKLGHFRSTVWVSDLATGKPVQGASVAIHTGVLEKLNFDAELVNVKTDANGVAVLPGLATLDPDLSLLRSYEDNAKRLMVLVSKGEDMALLPIMYNYEVSLWNVATDIYNDTSEKYGHMKAWGMTAQGVYRAGDTMQYKLFVRDQANSGFVAPPEGTYALEITDPTGKKIDRKEDIKLSTFGTFDGEYNIPQNAPVGWYQFKIEATLKRDGAKDAKKEFYPLSVLVSDFTPAPFRVSTELNGDAFKAGDTLDITADAKLHSGGAYGEAAIRSTVTLRSRAFTSKNPAAQGFSFDSFKDETDSEDIFQKDAKLDDKGEWKNSLTLPEKSIVYGQLVVESAVRDERGKSIASEARADYAGVDRLVGLKPTEWVFESKKPAIVKALVVDMKGAPVPGTKIALTIEKEEVVTAKVKGAGNAYLNDNTVEWRKTGSCNITSANEGADCTFTPDSAGTYRVTAAIKDSKNRDHSSEQTLWVSGGDYVQWNEGRENALPLIPEQAEYKVGDTARYLVKNPYPGAYALITVERLGVIDHWVQKLEGSTPVIEIPVKPDYTPGFYLSVVAMSGRVEAEVPKLGQIDLGKPTFRVGYAKTPVVDPYKSMIVTASADRSEYRPRDIVKVALEAKPLHDDEKEPIELAVAVLDEAVFDLIADGKNAFDPYHGFYDLENLDVLNHSLMTRLMGRQKFEKKGANPGGDGGIDASMRNLFKYVSYWNPSVPVDANGKANIEFEAPDNLTGWRVLALAVTPTDRMGLGDANFKVNRPTELRPVMPNQVREGDNFEVGFSVMNRTDAPRTIKVSLKASGDLTGQGQAAHEESVTLEPYKRTTIYLPLKAAVLPTTRDVPEGKITFTATASDDVDADGLEHALPVLKSRTTEVAANYGTTTESSVEESIAVPKNIYTDSSDLSLTLSPSVIGNLDGALKYMRDYAYPCWEQKISTALMAVNYIKLKPWLDETTVWDGANTLPQTILDMASNYQAPNGGMAYYVGKDDYADPYLSAYTALAFKRLTDAGYTVPVQVREKLDEYLLNFLRNKAAPDYYQGGMTSTVRAVILAALKDKIESGDIIRFRTELRYMSLFGKAQFAEAALAFPETRAAANTALDMILSAGDETSGKFSLEQSYTDGFTRILSTPMRDNCAALTAILQFDNESVQDIPFKLVRYITQTRDGRDYWENTQENIFCMNALVDYAAKYESVAPKMRVSAAYNKKPLGTATFQSVQDESVTLSKPLEEKDAGKKGMLSIQRDGDGILYYATRLRYAPKDQKDAVNAGIDIRREYSIKKDGKWAIAPSPLTIKRGDLVKVDIFLSLPSARNFVVVNDPLPGGLETVNRDLATASNVDADQAQFDEEGGSYWFKFSDWVDYGASRWSFYHKELRHDSARFYADWLDTGNYHLSYMAQAVADGVFAAPPVKAEEMYDPDIFGLGVKEELRVEKTP